MTVPDNPLLASPFEITEKRADGTVEITKFDGETFGQRLIMPAADLKRAIQETRSANRPNNGMTKKGDRRLIADIPREVWLDWVREYGPSLYQDFPLIKKLIRKFGFQTVDPGSF